MSWSADGQAGTACRVCSSRRRHARKRGGARARIKLRNGRSAHVIHGLGRERLVARAPNYNGRRPRDGPPPVRINRCAPSTNRFLSPAPCATALMASLRDWRALPSGSANRQPLSVAVLGGSISTGSTFSVRRGEEAKWLFHSKLGRALEAAFKTRVAIHNGALPKSPGLF